MKLFRIIVNGVDMGTQPAAGKTALEYQHALTHGGEYDGKSCRVIERIRIVAPTEDDLRKRWKIKRERE